MQPTSKDIEAAKTYLRQRINAEHSMTYNLEIVMREAAERVVGILYKSNITPAVGSFENLPMRVKLQIEEVVQWLKETIEDYFTTLAIYDHDENKDIILPFLFEKNHGMTFGERLDDYCGKYRDELFLLIMAGVSLGLAKKMVAKSIGSNLKQPYKNPDLADGISVPLTYGRGRTNSMFTAISGLTTYGIAKGWMRNWEIETKKDGAIGWIVQRGSSYPCEQCDDNCGFHSIDEGTQLPQHLSCCCFAVPVYKE